jgi:hypothetical protein
MLRDLVEDDDDEGEEESVERSTSNYSMSPSNKVKVAATGFKGLFSTARFGTVG